MRDLATDQEFWRDFAEIQDRLITEAVERDVWGTSRMTPSWKYCGRSCSWWLTKRSAFQAMSDLCEATVTIDGVTHCCAKEADHTDIRPRDWHQHIVTVERDRGLAKEAYLIWRTQ